MSGEREKGLLLPVPPILKSSVTADVTLEIASEDYKTRSSSSSKEEEMKEKPLTLTSKPSEVSFT
jgi:hypothetical protein